MRTEKLATKNVNANAKPFKIEHLYHTFSYSDFLAMSCTQYIEFRGAGFWVFDVVSSVFLKFLMNAAEEQITANPEDWLRESISHWRINATTTDFGFYLNDDWTEAETAVVIAMCRAAIEAIRVRGNISAVDLQSQPILDDLFIDTRGIDLIPSQPIIKFGEAVTALLENKLSKPPLHHSWIFDLDDEIRMIPMKSNS